MEAPAVSRRTSCSRDLRHRILTQELEPGSPLDEVELAATYGISRPPLREILRELAGEGYVELRENRGASVTPMTHKTLRNFFSAAPMIYAATTRLAAFHATPKQILRLKEAQRAFRQAIRAGGAADRALANVRFHEIIGEMADNEYLMPALRRLLIDHARMSITFYNPRRLAPVAQEQARAADQHDELIALIEAGQGEAAGTLAIAHWELCRAEFESFVAPESLPLRQSMLEGLHGVP